MPNYYEGFQEGKVNNFGGNFKIPSPGEYEAIIGKDVKLNTNDKNGKISILIPFELVDTYTAGGAPGDRDSIGLTLRSYTSPNAKMGKQTLAMIIGHSGNFMYFKDKYGLDIPNLDSSTFRAFMNDLINVLPGNRIMVKVDHSTGQTGGKMANLVGLGPSLKAKAKPAPTPEAEPTNPKSWEE